MKNKIIDGKLIANKIKDEIIAEIIAMSKGDLMVSERPNLAIILVGDRKDSEVYVNLKEKEAKKVGIDTHLYKFSKETIEKELLDTIEFLNNDSNIDGILLQLPLPEKLDTDKIIESINPGKDIDCFHPENLKKLDLKCSFNNESIPPLIQVILEILSFVDIDIKDKNVCAIVNSNVLGDSIRRVLECRGARVNIANANETGLADKTSEADVLISAVGRPKFIKKEHIKKDACLIDIGINKVDDKICGDVDMDDVMDKVGHITPVPGGVGPITIATALRNTLHIYKKNK